MTCSREQEPGELSDKVAFGRKPAGTEKVAHACEGWGAGRGEGGEFPCRRPQARGAASVRLRCPPGALQVAFVVTGSPQSRWRLGMQVSPAS